MPCASGGGGGGAKGSVGGGVGGGVERLRNAILLFIREMFTIPKELLARIQIYSVRITRFF